MHLLSTYLYSFPRGNFLNAALQKQSGENAVFIVQPDVKAMAAALQLCCFRVEELFCHHAS